MQAAQCSILISEKLEVNLRIKTCPKTDRSKTLFGSAATARLLCRPLIVEIPHRRTRPACIHEHKLVHEFDGQVGGQGGWWLAGPMVD